MKVTQCNIAHSLEKPKYLFSNLYWQDLEGQYHFSAQFTADLIGYASTNVWWITLDEKSFSYNLRRIGSERVFTVTFDLLKPIATPEAPWGWKE
jgi:hypothetical protein